MSNRTTSYSNGSSSTRSGGSRSSSGRSSRSGSSKPSYRRGTSQLNGGKRKRKRQKGQNYLRHTQGFGRSSNSRDSRTPYAIIMVAVAALLFFAAVISYLNRDVEITLNGEAVDVRIHSTIEEIIEDQELELSSGDLLAVDDSILEKGAGDSCSVTMDGEEVDASDIDEVEVEGGEVLEIGDGADVYEDHDIEATIIEPGIEVNGSGAIKYVETWGVEGRSEIWTGKISGITQDRGVVVEPVDCVIQCTSVVPDDEDAQYVAITFDEGPSEYTEQILEILEEKGVQATFFLEGDSVEEYTEAAQAVADSGNEVGSATYSDTTLSSLSGTDLRSQIANGFDAIEEATGLTVTMMRPPSGSFSTENWAESMDLFSAIVTWNLDSGDWLLQGADTVVETVVGSASNGDIILLTDNDECGAQTVEALPEIIDGLQEEGFTIVTVSELVATDSDLVSEVSLTSIDMPSDATLPTVSTEEETETEAE